MEMLQEKSVHYEDDIQMVMLLVKDDERFTQAGDRARHWLLHYFAYQRQVSDPQSPLSDERLGSAFDVYHCLVTDTGDCTRH